MREVRNCRKCNAMFATNEKEILCKRCREEEDQIFKMVRDYVYENPGTSVSELAVMFNLSVKRIDRYIRDGGFNVV